MASIIYLALLVVVALAAPWIAAQPREGTGSNLLPVIPYNPNQSDFANAGYTGPFDPQFRISAEGEMKPLTGTERHLLGTGRRGEDLLSGLIHGTRISLTAGFVSMAIAGVVGILLGALAGYCGDRKLRITRGCMVTLLIGTVPAYFYGFVVPAASRSADEDYTASFAVRFGLSMLIALAVLYLFYRSGRLLEKGSVHFRKKTYIPADSLVSRMMEVLTSLPILMLIITIAAISRPSLFNLVAIIGFTSWTGIARFTRAEILRIRQLEFVQSAQALAFSEARILLRHILPNALTPALVAITFGIAEAILYESSLSFLGVGVPPELVTWGSLLSKGREEFSAWWLVVFPGIAIFSTVIALNVLGEKLREAMDPKG